VTPISPLSPLRRLRPLNRKGFRRDLLRRPPLLLVRADEVIMFGPLLLVAPMYGPAVRSKKISTTWR
jgi:hypothetical protein